MSIYPERNKRGDYTGRWINEQRVDGKKLRTYHATMREAEQQQEAGADKSAGAPPELTLGALAQLVDGKMWRGHKDALQSGQRWLTCLDLLGRKTPVANVRKVALEALVDRLRAGGRFGQRSPKTINRYLASVSAVLRWAHEADLIAGMPAIPWQKEGEGRKVYLRDEDEPAFMQALRQTYGDDYAYAAEVLLMTGMRVGELLSLQPEDVHDDAVHLADTKTGKPRTIPLPVGQSGNLRRWLSVSHVRYRDLLRAISTTGLSVCGVKLTPHALRHTTATRLVARGVNSLTVAKIMGHSSLATTKGYTHFEVDTLRAAMGSLGRGNYGADRSQSGGKLLRKGRFVPPEGICSPLRSHSATRPKVNSDSDL